ncbi:MAG: glycerophosphodiester phosphodiesterase [Lachnospiraceae bacterium]|nr:glycerophosphodiester phosphodiesterase [Lachnospiraceae bacterium]
MKNIVVEGHRGYCAKYPENTMLSYEKAIELGVDAIEFDIWLSKDGVPVLMHDENAYRVSGVDKKLGEMTLEEIKELDAGKRFQDGRYSGEKVPTLLELLQLVKSRKPELKLGVEIKKYTEETVDKTVALLKEFGFFDECWFYCFNARIIKYIKTKYNGRTMGYPDFQMAEFEPDSYDYYDEIGLSMRLVTSEVFEIYRAKNLPMHMYCADTEEAVRLCIEKGASLITANDPVALMSIVKS